MMSITTCFCAVVALIVTGRVEATTEDHVALSAGKGDTVHVDISTETGAMTLYVDNELWLNLGGSSPLNVNVDLAILYARATSGQDHNYGPYSRITLGWSTSTSLEDILIETSVIAYKERELIIFEQHWPKGFKNDMQNNHTILSIFPALHTTSPANLGFLTWGSCFAAAVINGAWNGKHKSSFDGISYGSPLVLHKQRTSDNETKRKMRALVISPMENFFVSGQAATHDGKTIDCGIRSTVEELPVGFSHSSMVVVGHGINGTMVEWGDILLKRGDKKRTDPYKDFALSHVGFWTDNGAYYYTGIHTNFSNPEAMLRGAKADFEKRDIPVRYFQWDDWWMESKGDHPGIMSWAPKPDVFPSGFTDWLGAPLVLYAPMYAADNDWTTHYHFKNDPDGKKSSIPLDPNFYRDLFQNGTRIGMKMFEQDFLCEQGYGGTGLTKTDVISGKLWMEQMDKAAQVTGTTLQFCMMNPYHALHSTLVKTMTNGRATYDNTRKVAWNIQAMGQNGMLFYSLGFLPSRDNVWTTRSDVEQPLCGNRDVCYEPNAHADNAVAALSGGPYGIADKVGFTNRSVVMHSCRDDGVLLKPDWPLSSLDFTFTDTDAKGAFVWAAHDDFGPFRWSYIIGINVDYTVSITPRRLQGAVSRPMVAWKVSLDVPGPISVIQFSDDNPLLLPASPATSKVAAGLSHYTAAPVLPNGMVLLGDISKWTTMSHRRVNSLLIDGTNIIAELYGSPNENISFAYVETPSSTVYHVVCDFGLSTNCKSKDYHGNTDCRLKLLCTRGRCFCGSSSEHLSVFQALK
mmetsp:Transcript_435/g.476  ORF Transcript_435/g.476 Transcript_435/m.476 type:complete len:801 (+) Transcript_435:113-2515(+)|eukprot:CAMPEP_0204830330 /NCGR_PEP_ID=MMETSP1346-20131115/8470_1 /ASSEMBLY_ACC=CAM_ASM_000771 /TAXON_ID=215587 /ORGANISM="Aplanochytrium stocchinoi, Strain GSBS06" /LENGTH=800 /DNA_ID=CAMNT_0051960507 /DNA_START=32 /DNA_END=2434 /DNA_ORIENTATION=+